LQFNEAQTLRVSPQAEASNGFLACLPYRGPVGEPLTSRESGGAECYPREAVGRIAIITYARDVKIRAGSKRPALSKAALREFTPRLNQ
jgi:hypothetical protein